MELILFLECFIRLNTWKILSENTTRGSRGDSSDLHHSKHPDNTSSTRSTSVWENNRNTTAVKTHFKSNVLQIKLMMFCVGCWTLCPPDDVSSSVDAPRDALSCQEVS